MISAILDILASVFGIARKTLELENSPEMQANKVARTDQQIKDEAREAIAKGDLDKIRKMEAE